MGAMLPEQEKRQREIDGEHPAWLEDCGERLSLIKVFARNPKDALVPPLASRSPKGVARIGSEQVCLPDWLLPRK